MSLTDSEEWGAGAGRSVRRGKWLPPHRPKSDASEGQPDSTHIEVEHAEGGEEAGDAFW